MPRIGAFALVFAPLVPVAASQQLPPGVGARVRLEAPSLVTGRVIGTVMAATRDSLYIAVPVPGVRPDRAEAVQNLIVSRDKIRLLEVHRGSSRFKGAKAGARAGFLVGLIATLGFTAAAVARGDGYGIILLPQLGSIATVSTTVIGALIGTAVPTENWETMIRR